MSSPNTTDTTLSPGCREQRPCSPQVWLTPPDCPNCGKPLSEAPAAWKSRGEWMCHEDHDGKRIWFNYELTMILRARLREANDKSPSTGAKE